MNKKKRSGTGGGRKGPPETKQTEDYGVNKFQNDGSFLEMFKQCQQPKVADPQSSSTVTPQPHEQSHNKGSKDSKEEANGEKDTPYYSTQTMYYKEGSGSEKPQYQVTFKFILSPLFSWHS